MRQGVQSIGPEIAQSVKALVGSAGIIQISMSIGSRARCHREFGVNVVERARGILLTPKTEWLAIEREPGDAVFLFTKYMAILAAIPAACGFVGMSMIGRHVPMMGFYRTGIASGIVSAIVRYLLAFAIVYVLAIVVDALAPTFAGQRNQPNALKLTTYAMTPVWLAGALSLIPGLRLLGVLGLYGVYVFWLGVPLLMKVPKEKSAPYTAAVAVCGIVISLVVASILRASARAF
jgi:hypothetical protein